LLLASGRGGPRLASLVAALLVPAFALLAPALLPAAIAQRIAFVLWFGWWIVAASRMHPVAAARSGTS
jgi:hypothetical protein